MKYYLIKTNDSSSYFKRKIVMGNDMYLAVTDNPQNETVLFEGSLQECSDQFDKVKYELW